MGGRQFVNRYSIFGSVAILSILLIAGFASANNVWTESSYNDFTSSDSLSNVEVRGSAGDVGRVHLVDNQSETKSNIYDPENTTMLYNDASHNPQYGMYAQSFTPSINGVVDKVEVMIWYTGSPIHTNPDQSTPAAKVIISIVGVLLNLPNMNNIFSTINLTYTYFPTESGTWTTVWLSYSDSCGNNNNGRINYQNKLTANTKYFLIVESDADFDQNNEILLDEKTYDDPNTQGYYYQLVFGWTSNDWDFPFKIYVQNFKGSGFLISNVHDTTLGQTAQLSSVNWNYQTPPGPGQNPNSYSLHIYTRGGNTNPPDQTWTGWTEQTNFKGSYNPATPVPNGQYIQYKFTLSSTEDCFTPYIDSVTIVTQ